MSNNTLAYARAYRLENRERILKQRRAYYQQHKAHHAEGVNRYHQANVEAHRASTNKWRTAHLARYRELQRQYAAAHPDGVRERNALRRARKAGATVERVYRSIVFKRDTGLCGECGITVDPNNWHLDHVVPLARGGAHSYVNTQVTHPMCNLRKGAKVAA